MDYIKALGMFAGIVIGFAGYVWLIYSLPLFPGMVVAWAPFLCWVFGICLHLVRARNRKESPDAAR